ncbi:MAG: AI-2E family transporter [Steroidobacterales bacterium]
MKPDHPPVRSARPEGVQSRRPTPALIVLAICAVGTVLYLAHEVFVPVALALLFATVLSGTVEMLRRRGLPRAIGACLLLFVLLVIIGVIFNAVAEPARQWFANLPHTLRVIERKVHPAALVLNQIEALGDRAGAIGNPSGGAQHADAPAAGPAAASSVSAIEVLNLTRSGLVSTATVVILSLFLLSGGPPMLARMAASLADHVQAVQVLRVIDAIRNELGRYYGTLALINLGLGIATGVSMMLLGVPNPFLWGTMAALLNFIPYVGGATTLVVLAVVALVSFDGVGKIIAVPATYLGLAVIEGQVVQPLLVGRRLELNPLLVFLAVWFGGWMWGIAGIVIAVPTLVALKVAAEHSQGGGAVVAFLGPADAARGGLTRTRSRAGSGIVAGPGP